MKLFLFVAFLLFFVVVSADTTQERRGASAYALVDVVHAAHVEIVLIKLQPQPQPQLQPQPQPPLQLQLQLQRCVKNLADGTVPKFAVQTRRHIATSVSLKM